MAGDGDACILHRRIAIENDVRANVGVQRARNLIALAGDEAAVVAHGGRGGDNLATVIGSVVEAD